MSLTKKELCWVGNIPYLYSKPFFRQDNNESKSLWAGICIIIIITIMFIFKNNNRNNNLHLLKASCMSDTVLSAFLQANTIKILKCYHIHYQTAMTLSTLRNPSTALIIPVSSLHPLCLLPPEIKSINGDLQDPSPIVWPVPFWSVLLLNILKIITRFN